MNQLEGDMSGLHNGRHLCTNGPVVQDQSLIVGMPFQAIWLMENTVNTQFE
jgi:hypothetical protein